MCLLQANHNRVPFNFVMYENSTIPEHLSGGGGFSIVQVTLENLYEMHEHLRNYWTVSNHNLPLIRYQGCYVKLYQSNFIDYLFRAQTYPPFTSQQLTYTGMQPSLMMMLKGTTKMPSKHTIKKKKPFKKLYFPPPSLFENKWYFQHDIAKKPLIVFHTAATTLDSWYIAPTWENTNITIKTINTKLIKNHLWNKDYSQNTTPDGFAISTEGTRSRFLYSTPSDLPINDLQCKHMIYLGLTKQYKRGEAKFELASSISWTNYTNTYWGSIFYVEYTTNSLRLFQSETSWTKFKQKQESDKVNTFLTELTNPIILETRYNPSIDSGHNNNMYILSNSTAGYDYDPPHNLNLQLDGFPLWTAIYGFTDFIKRTQITQRTETDYFLTIATDTTRPIIDKIIPVDENFVEGKSTGHEKPTVWDADKWYPQLEYQREIMNILATTGPGAPKYTGIKSDEVKIEYEFRFKLGGNPPPMAEINNPLQQPTYPTTDNIIKTTSLQSPTTPPEYYLHSFDQRRYMLTKSAIERITKDISTKTSSLSTTTGISLEPAIQTHQTSEDETSTEEEKEETLYEQLFRQRRKQLQLKHRIMETLQQIQNLE